MPARGLCREAPPDASGTDPIMTDNMDDASQGVVDTAEPAALPDTIAPASGQGEEAGHSTAETQPALQAEAPKEPKGEPWFVKRLDKQRQELADARARIAEYERAQRPAASAETAPQAGTPADVDRLATERAGQIATARAFDEDCNSIAKAGQAAHPDFTDAIKNLNRVGQITPDLIEAVKEAGDPAALLYALGKDPAEAERILALSPARMGAALAKLAARPAPTVPVSRAPAPLTPVAGTARIEADPEKMSMEDYVKWRDARDAKRK